MNPKINYDIDSEDLENYLHKLNCNKIPNTKITFRVVYDDNSETYSTTCHKETLTDLIAICNKGK